MTRGAVVEAGDPAAPLQVVRHLDRGGVALVPDGSSYVLATDPLRESAVANLLEAVGHPGDAPVPVLVPNLHAVQHVARLTPLGKRLADASPAGDLTLLLPARGTVPPNLPGDGDAVAVRVAPDGFARRLTERFGPVTGIAACLHGEPAPSTTAEALGQVGDIVDVVVEGGRQEGEASTVVDATGEAPKVIRPGAVPRDELVEHHG